MKRYIIAAVFAVFGLFASGFAVTKADELRGIGGLWLARYESPQTVSAARLDEITALDPGSFALVYEQSREIAAPLFLRRKQLTVVEAAGDASLLFLPGRLRSGGYPGSPSDCLIDEASAVELWGTGVPLGFAVEIDGVEYKVCGVIESARPLVLTAGGSGRESVFTSVLFRAGEDMKFPSQDFSLLTANLSPEQPAVTERGLLAARLRFFSLLPLWLLFMLAVRRFALGFLPKSAALRAAVMLLAAVLGVWLLRMPNPLTPEMLPAYWSDFSFWPRRFETLSDRACTAWRLPGTMADLLLAIETVLPSAACTVFAAVSFVAANRVMRVRNGRSDP